MARDSSSFIDAMPLPDNLLVLGQASLLTFNICWLRANPLPLGLLNESSNGPETDGKGSPLRHSGCSSSGRQPIGGQLERASLGVG